MSLSIIAAVSENNAIGKNNQLLWHLPNDLKFFKNKTWGFPVIMGRKTYESVNKPLPGRMNIVITTNANWIATGVTTAISLEDAIQKAEASHCKEIFIIGGGEIYRQAMPLADTLYITRVRTTIEGDTFFPEIDAKKWTMISNEDYKADEKNALDYSFQCWKTNPNQ